MTEKEQQKLEAAQKRMKALEKQLEDAQMKNIALETIDLCWLRFHSFQQGQ